MSRCSTRKVSGVEHDEVDRIIEAWQRERPDLDTTPLGVLSRVSRLARHLDRRRRDAFSQVTVDGSGLEPWEFDVLAALRRAGSPYELSPSELMAQTLVTSGTMTTRVEKLAARKLVRRRRRETGDRRGVRVQLTDAGRDVVDAAFEALLTHERTLLSSLPAAEQADLATLLRSLVLPFDDSET
jgi:DNA-binding MarR family transcriptional regulator